MIGEVVLTVDRNQYTLKFETIHIRTIGTVLNGIYGTILYKCSRRTIGENNMGVLPFRHSVCFWCICVCR